MSKIKRFLCILTACVVLVFGCYFLPRQKADAFVALPVIGTVAAVAAIGLLLYGVCTSDTENPSNNSFLNDASLFIADACGFGALLKPEDRVYTNTVAASSFLAAAKTQAALAYATGVCSTVMGGAASEPAFDTKYNSSKDFVLVDFPAYATATTITRETIDTKCDFNFRKTGYPFSSSFYIVADGSNLISFVVGSYSIFQGSYPANYPFLNIVYQHNSPVNAGGNMTLRLAPISYQCSTINIDGRNFYTNTERFDAKYLDSIIAAFAAAGISVPVFDSARDNVYFSANVSKPLDPGLEIDIPISFSPAIPGACDVFDGLKSLDDYHVDSPGNDVINFGDLLDKTGCPTLDDVIGKVNDGELTVADVQIGLGTWPYVDVGTETGEIATPDIPKELTRPIALDQSLAIPSDIAATDTYQPLNPPADKSSSSRPNGSFTLPLYKFFPFCLPWDIYQVLSIFDVEPKAPVITIPLGSFFSDIPGVDSSTTDYVTEIDLGDDQFSKWFLILRNLEKIGIIIGFVLISRYLIHGGD